MAQRYSQATFISGGRLKYQGSENRAVSENRFINQGNKKPLDPTATLKVAKRGQRQQDRTVLLLLCVIALLYSNLAFNPEAFRLFVFYVTSAPMSTGKIRCLRFVSTARLPSRQS